VALWLVRNRLVTGYVTGMSRTDFREAAERTGFADNVIAMGKALALDFFGWGAMGERRFLFEGAPVPHAGVTIAGAILGTAAAAGLVMLALRGERGRRADLDEGARNESVRPYESVRPGEEPRRAAALVVAFLAAHAIALIALWSIGNNDPIHTRYVAPIAWCIVALVALAIQQACGGPQRRSAIALAVVLAAVVLIPNADKSRALWSPSPGENLIKRTLRAPDDLWQRSLTWEEAATPLPR
jgi:hypothetical protein